MKTLYLLRHADTVHSFPDFTRELTSKGMRQAVMLSEYMSAHNIFPDTVLSSDAIRTRQTLAHINTAHTSFLNILYNASAETILKIISDLDDNLNSVMIVGHNPGITTAGITIGATCDKAMDFSSTCKLVAISFMGLWRDMKSPFHSHVFIPEVEV